MFKIIRRTYFDRFQKHLRDLEKHLNEGDYIQAAEKLWGAISSFVNAFAKTEVKDMEYKKREFEVLLNMLSIEYKHLRDVMKREGFSDAYDFASKAAGLHIYFYGGRDYPEEKIERVLLSAVKVLKEIHNVILQKLSLK